MVIPSILSNCLSALKCQHCHIANIKALLNWLSSQRTLSCWCHSVFGPCNSDSVVTDPANTITLFFIFSLSLLFTSCLPLQQRCQQQMCWVTQLIVVSFQSDHGLELKSLHSWEGNRKQITEGLNPCTHMHMYTQKAPQMQDVTVVQLWIARWRNLSDWLRLWYHGRRGGADGVSLNVTHPTSFLMPIFRRLWLVDEDYNKHSRVCGERGGSDCLRAAVPWCIYTCKGKISLTEGCFYGYTYPGLY